MNFNMFGIPLTGSDICGYYGTSVNEELCGRWFQLAKFSPLARQDTSGGAPSEPYLLGEPYQSWAISSLY